MRRVGWSAALAAAACGRIGFDANHDSGAAADTANPPPAGLHALTAGTAHSCALRAGRAYCWGENTEGQLGDGTTGTRTRPTEVALPAGTVTRLAAGSSHTCATVNDAMYCWGSNASGEVGASPLGGRFPSPRAIALPGPATAIAAGESFACAIVAGEVYCWGNDDNGRLGNGAPGTGTTPRPVTPSRVVRAIALGIDHACSLDAAGVAECWGHNDAGTLGTGSLSPTETQTAVGLTVLARVDEISLAAFHACARVGERAWCWGDGTSGQLGDGSQAPSLTAVTPQGLDAGVTRIATGGDGSTDASCAIAGGVVVCWGGGANGRIGNGSVADALVPATVLGVPGSAREVALGQDHTCAAFSDDSTWCWGLGTSGQLGDGTTASRLAPVRVIDP